MLEHQRVLRNQHIYLLISKDCTHLCAINQGERNGQRVNRRMVSTYSKVQTGMKRKQKTDWYLSNTRHVVRLWSVLLRVVFSSLPFLTQLSIPIPSLQFRTLYLCVYVCIYLYVCIKVQRQRDRDRNRDKCAVRVTITLVVRLSSRPANENYL